ncbi:MAG: hypothetical protein HQ518_15130 [Rhodopirellula sp.]|nr:hypothetical protein [Rhodopirellula sp.]
MPLSERESGFDLSLETGVKIPRQNSERTNVPGALPAAESMAILPARITQDLNNVGCHPVYLNSSPVR